jgi:anionic cell wall polymer biosynthesis LytR-Cps2A-Psr (LCP) family protein
MKFLKGYLVILILLVSSPSFAQYTSKGVGGKSCSFLLENFDPTSKIVMTQWITGFITGLNREQNKNKGKGVDETAMLYEVKNFCERNPLKDILDGAVWLYYERL